MKSLDYEVVSASPIWTAVLRFCLIHAFDLVSRPPYLFETRRPFYIYDPSEHLSSPFQCRGSLSWKMNGPISPASVLPDYAPRYCAV